MQLRYMSALLLVTACAVRIAGAGAQQTDHATGQAIVVSGCVQQEHRVLRTSPGNLGLGDEYVLTRSTVRGGDAPSRNRSGATAATAGVKDAAGPTVAGTIYRLTGEREAELKQYLGLGVEITGRFATPGDAALDARRAATPADPKDAQKPPKSDSVPEIAIQSIRSLSLSCPVDNPQ